MINLDGAHLEGGGSLVRVALALSTLTGKEFKVTKIRAGRKEPGLKAQHLTAIQALKEICNAKTNDISLGSTELWFKPGKMKNGRFKMDIGTAGSISLLLQALLLPCLFAPGKITLNIKGGTCGKWQASVDYIQNVLLPQLRRFVQRIEFRILKRGYYPKGGGEVKLEIVPKYKLSEYRAFSNFYQEINEKITKIKLFQQGKLEQIQGVVNISSELAEKQIGERIKKSAENTLRNYNVPTNIRVEYVQSLSLGGDIVLWTVYSTKGEVNFLNPTILGSNSLIEKGKTSEQVGKDAATKLAKEINTKSTVDRHLTDQLIPFMALLSDSIITASEISQHTKTNIHVVEKFLNVKFKVDDKVITVNKLYC